MTANAQTTDPAEGRAFPDQGVFIGPVPAWVQASPIEGVLPPRPGDAVTCLLLEHQIHAELCQTHVRTVLRLETMQGVQQLSQWRLEFEPQTQSVFLHWVKIRRGDTEFNHLTAEKLRLLQRESGLDGVVIDGWFTLLLVLEDVRPGDVLDACYTIEHRPRLLSDRCQRMFQPAPGLRTAHYHLAVQFAPGRPMKWRASTPEIAPEETRTTDLVRWTWAGTNAGDAKPEANTPPWHLEGPWMQVSDCENWSVVAAALAAAWSEQPEDAQVAELAAAITREEADPLQQIDRAIRLVQDEHRYLSVNLELGGQIPAAPGEVARRRYGDCKDLSFLLVHLLRRLGVPARPVLVDSQLRKSVADLLPSARFNHVIVEFTARGEKRWVDATARFQGGGALGRPVTDFGWGLPVDAAAAALIAQPLPFDLLNRFELHESFLIDTTGEPSAVAVTVRANGAPAERLRRRFETTPLDDIAREQLQSAGERYGKTTRVGVVQFRDDRAANEFVLAEVFEINHFLNLSNEPGKCRFAFPPSLVAAALPLPESDPRRAPFALPEPGELCHIVEVEFPTLQPSAAPRLRFENEFIEFNRRQRSLHAFYSVTNELITRADAVPAERLGEYTETVANIRRETQFVLTLPVGYARVRMNRTFGDLPPLPPAPYTPPTEPAAGTLAPMADSSAPGVAGALPRNPSANDDPADNAPRRRRRTKMKRGEPIWPVITIIVLIIAVFVLLVLFR